MPPPHRIIYPAAALNDTPTWLPAETPIAATDCFVIRATVGWLDRDQAIYESLLSIKRAGADMILTYFAKDATRVLHEDFGV